MWALKLWTRSTNRFSASSRLPPPGSKKGVVKRLIQSAASRTWASASASCGLTAFVGSGPRLGSVSTTWSFAGRVRPIQC